MKNFLLFVLLFCLTCSFVDSQHKYKTKDSNQLSGNPNMPVYYQQGYNMKLWMSNSGILGRYGNDNYTVNLEYPIGSKVEHLWGGGPIIGVKLYNLNPLTFERYLVTEMHNNYDGRNEARSNFDHFWQTSADTLNGHNRRYFDDDGDGRADEDELDGEDNDGDWSPLTDDVGSDGLADKFEVSCDGIPYDSLTNPDPADDNYDPLKKAKCPVNYTGTRPFKNDLNIYTEKNNKPDHSEPHVDEDYGAVSANDVYCTYADTFSRPIYGGHVPLGLKVLQRSFAWKDKIKEPILPIEYTFINIGNHMWKDVYIAFWLDPDVGPIDVNGYEQHNYVSYFDSLRTYYCNNAIDRGSTPIGLTLLDASRPLDSLNYIFQWFDYSNTRTDQSVNDSLLYSIMTGGTYPNYPISPPSDPTNPSDTRFILSFGPFKDMYPGDTAKVTIALVSGDAVADVPNSLKDNAAKAISIYKHDYENLTIPSPPLCITREGMNVKLDWKWKPGDPGFDPLENWEVGNDYFETLPDTHWRKINPPVGITKGGRNFEGFKVWRSESDTFNVNTFALLAQYDIKDDLNLGAQTGLQYTYTDSLTKPYNKYWYAVTSYSIPEGIKLIYPDPEGIIRRSYFVGNGLESVIKENAQKMHLIFEPSKKFGEVLAVPNPYRSDVSYTDGLGFEGASYNWTPDKRTMWFIHLPTKATIRIYTIAGDIVKTIHHDDASRIARGLTIGQEEWDMMSDSYRPAASGVFVFSVDSDFGQQIGKFVIIK